MTNTKLKNGMTLNEIMIALVIMAVAFIPIIGVMSSSIKTTQKDENIIRAINICQETLNTALQFPFNEIKVGNFTTDIKSANTNLQSIIRLGNIAMGSVTYETSLKVEHPSSLVINVPMCDFTAKAQDTSGDPANWMRTRQRQVKDLVKRYTVTVNWKDTDGHKKFYRLSALKADIRR